MARIDAEGLLGSSQIKRVVSSLAVSGCNAIPACPILLPRLEILVPGPQLSRRLTLISCLPVFFFGSLGLFVSVVASTRFQANMILAIVLLGVAVCAVMPGRNAWRVVGSLLSTWWDVHWWSLPGCFGVHWDAVAIAVTGIVAVTGLLRIAAVYSFERTGR